MSIEEGGRTMKRNALVFATYVALVGACVFVLVGCAVLTTSQVQEIKRFSQASDAYTELPGALARSYGALVRDSTLLALSRQEFSTDDTTRADNAWRKIVQAYDTEQEFDAAGDRMDGALAVLKQYSQILTQLVADDYTDALGESSAKLGTSFDSALSAYNNKYRVANPLPIVGGKIAEAIRLAGGLYIRHRQAQILKDTIEKANPLIQGLMGDVKTIADNKVDDYAAYETTHLKTPFNEVANETRRLTVTTIAAVYDDLSRARAGKTLAKKVGDAAAKYTSAHQALVDKTRKRMDLKELIAEIQALRIEVKAAQDIKAKVEK
jgi:hypothetical protein